MFDEIGRSFTSCSRCRSRTSVAFERLRRRAELEGRADDTDEAIRRRLENYHRETEPLIEHYRDARQPGPDPRRPAARTRSSREIQSALEQVPA